MSGVNFYDLVRMGERDAARRESGARPLNEFEQPAEAAAQALLQAIKNGKSGVSTKNWKPVSARDRGGATAYGITYGNIQLVLEDYAALASDRGEAYSLTVKDRRGREVGFLRGAAKGPVAELGKTIFNALETPDASGVARTIRELGS